MARRTIHIPDNLDQRVVDLGSTEDSYSGIVQEALREFLDDAEEDAVSEDPDEGVVVEE
jgi:predicted transcriptional regulator